MTAIVSDSDASLALMTAIVSDAKTFLALMTAIVSESEAFLALMTAMRSRRIAFERYLVDSNCRSIFVIVRRKPDRRRTPVARVRNAHMVRAWPFAFLVFAASVLYCDARIIVAVDMDQVADADAEGGAGPISDFIWYVLDEKEGTTAKDSSSHHYDITGITGVTWSRGANFDGVSGGGSTTVDPSYRVPPITFSAWLTPQARSDQTLNQNGLIPYPTNAIGDDAPFLYGYGIGLNVWTDGDAGSAVAAESVDTCITPLLPCVAHPSAGDAGSFLVGQEYFIVAAVGAPIDDASPVTAQVYVDGALYDQTTAAIPAAAARTTLYLGHHNMDTIYGSKGVFDGRIRDARVYKRQLGEVEVARLFASGPTTRAPTSDRADAPSD